MFVLNFYLNIKILSLRSQHLQILLPLHSTVLIRTTAAVAAIIIAETGITATFFGTAV
jgi:hypothetical protein